METIIKLSRVALLILAINLIVLRVWVGEDAFIFFKYVDNFVSGNGLVFNIGERVEGFTAPLWVFILAFFRVFTRFELRPMAIFLGLFLSLTAISLLLFADKKGKVIFPVGVIMLITNSAFRDFATSGFETSLTYLLVVVFALLVKEGSEALRSAKPKGSEALLTKKPLWLGLTLSLMILNRPETMLIFAYFFGVFVLSFGTKSVRSLLVFLIPFLVLVVGYEIFRLSYYHAFFPNTFYAKRGGDFYISQGFNYLKDFFLSYPYSVFVIAALCFYAIFVVRNRYKKTKHLDGRAHLILSAGLLISYVLYSGGDYMHGRSLLMAFILLCVAVNDLYDELLKKLVSGDFSFVLFGLGIFLLLFLIFNGQKSYTDRVGKEINNIGDQRAQFSLGFEPENIKQYLNQRITEEFGWKASGLYYKEVSEKTDVPISIVYYNIGFFGYAVGDNVNVLGGSLIDPYLARLPLESRGKIGHEDIPPWEYIFSRKPTFTYTPFKEWNSSAQFKYEQAEYADVIVGDSNGSLHPVFDLSHTEFIKNFSVLVGKDIKKEIDDAQRKYLQGLNEDQVSSNYDYVNEYMGFLKLYWHPYAVESDKALFDEKFKLLDADRKLSKYEKFMTDGYVEAQKIWEPIGGLISVSGIR